MPIDFLKPSTTDNYSTQFTQNIQANFVSVAQWLDSTNTTITGTVPTFSKRYNRTNALFEEYNGTAWATLPVSYLLKAGDTASGNIVFNNNVYVSGKTTGGTTIPILGITDTNVLQLGSGTATGGDTLIINGTERLRITAAGAATFVGTVAGTSFNSITGLASAAPAALGTAAVGTSTLAARSDHVHLLPTSFGTITGTSFNSITGLSAVVGTTPGTAATGTSTAAARADHVHPIQTTVSGNAGSITGQANSATITASTAATASQIVQRDASGDDFRRYGYGAYFNMSHVAAAATTDTIFYSSVDDFIRKNTAAGFRTSLNVPTRTGGDASGTWGINVTGSSSSCTGAAATATTATNANNINISAITSVDTVCSFVMVASQATGNQAPFIDSGITFNASTNNLSVLGNVTTSSDARIKTNIKTIDNALVKVQQLNGYTFDRTDISTPRQTGVIAQEVLKVLPEAVMGSEASMYKVAYGNMVGLLIEAIKEQQQQIDSLKTMVANLVGDNK